MVSYIATVIEHGILPPPQVQLGFQHQLEMFQTFLAKDTQDDRSLKLSKELIKIHYNKTLKFLKIFKTRPQ